MFYNFEASSGQRRVESLITIRADGDQGPVTSEEVCSGFVHQNAMHPRNSVQGSRRTKHKTHCPLDDQWAMLTTCVQGVLLFRTLRNP